jgi:predicted Fe-Mo cluster-binding NifX family protein
MKKIAVALSEDKKNVSSHFGTCATYLLVEVDGTEIVTKAEVENPHGHHQGGCVVPDFIKSLDADVIITGGMGVKAVEKCNNYGIEVILGHVGPVDEVVTGYLEGKIESTGGACTHHH